MAQESEGLDLDRFDRAILAVLVGDARASIVDLAPRVGLSRPTELDVHGNTAYAIVPTTYQYTVQARQILENGILTAALLKSGATWRVAAFAWTNQKTPAQHAR